MFNRLVTVFAMLLHPRQICNGRCTRTPASARNNALCTVITYWLRSTLYRDTAPVLSTNIVTGDKFAAPIIICTATAPERNKICTMTAKTRAKPSLHRDSFLVPPEAGDRFVAVLSEGYAY